jgi:hypothetical protein
VPVRTVELQFQLPARRIQRVPDDIYGSVLLVNGLPEMIAVPVIVSRRPERLKESPSY